MRAAGQPDLQAWMNEYHILGVSLAVIRAGKIDRVEAAAHLVPPPQPALAWLKQIYAM